jgi:hypothetical protein
MDDPGSHFLDELEAWAAEGLAEQAASSRARERWLRQQAEEEATFAGVLADLVERRTPVAVTSTSGRRHQGELIAVARDFAALRAPGGATVLLALDALAAVRPVPHRDVPPTGEARTPIRLSLLDVLARVAADRPRVHVGLRGGDGVTGELRAVGDDVVTLVLDGDPRGVAYVRVASMSDVSLFASG